MSVWSRVTLVGEARTVDMVLPAQEPLGALMPDVLQLLGDPVRNPPQLRHLVTSTGEVLDPGASLADRQVPDGAVLRLVRSDEPVPAPVVHEVPEVVGDSLDLRLLSWSPAAARWTATFTLVALSVGVGLVIRAGSSAATAAVATAGLAALLLLCGVVIGMAGREPAGLAMILGGGAAGLPALWWAAAADDWPTWGRWGGAALLLAVLVMLLGLSSPLGRGALVGGAAAVLLAGIGTACAASGLEPDRTGAVLALSCVVLLSVLLRTALSLSGLTSLDDRRSAGGAVPRVDLMAALDRAHRTMVIATLAVSVAAAVAGLGAATELGGSRGAWNAALAALLALVVAGRARVFPLVLQKAALLGAAVVIVIGLGVRWAEQVSWGIAPALGMLVVGLTAAVVVLTVHPAEHTRARLRRIMNRIEATAVIAIIPVAIGVFGIFARLRETF
ncbi:type VII secretion integral membrane protein EccD [Actinomadura pelletieri DSM 43383]|uniref:Type VII secretion integral membrane protein EccD n=1 Tax=Actinomadura pelletieri DSM 43383 TaxID=1120940 RepID=A0A495QP76_9ACTN|nr:type VII secretion integral membrane protein EccD [Actinomadura pelletieri]RKS74719.1 type VII secretion integral membrane protein EccD [Actinomadura pelletieri DSM 43383]